MFETIPAFNKIISFDYNGNIVVDYVNDYIPFDSKKYDINLTSFDVDVNNEGIFEYE